MFCSDGVLGNSGVLIGSRSHCARFLPNNPISDRRRQIAAQNMEAMAKFVPEGHEGWRVDMQQTGIDRARIRAVTGPRLSRAGARQTQLVGAAATGRCNRAQSARSVVPI